MFKEGLQSEEFQIGFFQIGFFQTKQESLDYIRNGVDLRLGTRRNVTVVKMKVTKVEESPGVCVPSFIVLIQCSTVFLKQYSVCS